MVDQRTWTTKEISLRRNSVRIEKRRPIWSPHVFISAADQIALKPSWQRWLAAGGNSDQQQANQQQQESFYLRAQPQANTENIAQIKQIAQVKLQLQA
ncbi:MAG: hypothetical protein P8M80_18040 [Pirellulaceae bacterium]|nr:hypothetical protein [Pirellulaceae bacterium]